MTLKNLKIAINDQQPLDEVVKELERLGYARIHKSRYPNFVITNKFGGYGVYMSMNLDEPNTTLAELKEM